MAAALLRPWPGIGRKLTSGSPADIASRDVSPPAFSTRTSHAAITPAMSSLQPSTTATQAITVPTITAASPPGTPPGRRTFAVQAISTMPREMNEIHGTSHIWKAGRSEMKAIDIPANVPSIAARGVSRRIVGPIKAPISTITPIMKAQARPACQARIAAGPSPIVDEFLR